MMGKAASAPARESREERAKREIGHTHITRVQSYVLTCGFLLVVALVPVGQIAEEWRAHAQGRRPNPLPGFLDIVLSARDAMTAIVRPAGTDQEKIGARLKVANDTLQQGAARYERKLADDSWLTRVFLPPVQTVFTNWLGVGSEQVYVGESGWLFYRPDVEHLTGRGFLEWPVILGRLHEGSEWRRAPQPDPVLAILHFQVQLAARGIRLVVMPTPAKAALYPDKFSSRFDRGSDVVVNRSFGPFIDEIRNPRAFFEGRAARYASHLRDPALREVARGLDAMATGRAALLRSPILVFDPSTALAGRKRAGGEAVYLRTDSHWSPRGVDAVAQDLAAFLRESVDLPDGVTRGERRALAVTNRGDTAAMLRLPENHPAICKEEAVTQRVENPPSEFGEGAPVLLLGDSYSNIYSDPGLGWSEGAGLAEQLGYHLGTRVARIAINAGGAHASRAELARRLREWNDGGWGPAPSDPLESVRVIVYQFAGRELSDGDWQLVDLPNLEIRELTKGKSASDGPRSGQPTAPARARTPVAEFEAPPAPEAPAPDTAPLVLVGEVLKTSALPQPFSAPYDDCLTTWLVRVDGVEGGTHGDGIVLVVVLGMKENVWLPSASIRPGDRRRLHLIPLRKASATIRATQRVDDTDDFSHPPYFAVSVEEP